MYFSHDNSAIATHLLPRMRLVRSILGLSQPDTYGVRGHPRQDRQLGPKGVRAVCEAADYPIEPGRIVRRGGGRGFF
jgi:hypothetical protein